MRNARSIVAAAVVPLLALAACDGEGDKADASRDGVSSSDAASQAFDPDRQPPARPIRGAAVGGTLHYLDADATINTLDPAQAYNYEGLALMQGLVERSLTQYVFDPDLGSMVLVPDIATDLGRPNADFTEWTFTIRDGVRFEDGSEVTAEDVAFGIKRSFDRTSFAEGPGYSSDFFLHGDSYEGPYRSGTNYDGIVVDGDTLTLKMERPFPDLPYWATFPAMGPVPEQNSDATEYGRHPLATGPYKIAEFTPNKSITLVQNEQWDPDTDPGRHQYPDRIIVRVGASSRRIDATIFGDSVQGRTTLTSDSVFSDEYRVGHELGRLASGSNGCTIMIYPDYRRITDIRVRQAISYAWPRQDGAGIRFLVIGATALTGKSILPPGFPGRPDEGADTQSWEADPDKAKALLQEAGWDPGEFQLKFTYIAHDPFNVAMMHARVDAFEAAGFKVKAIGTTAEQSELMQNDPGAPINVRWGGWCPDWPSGSSWFPPMFDSVTDRPDANRAQFSEPAVDEEIDRIGKLPLDEQPAAWGALDEMIRTDYYPVIVDFYQGVALPHGSRVGGMHVDGFGMPTWKDIYVIN